MELDISQGCVRLGTDKFKKRKANLELCRRNGVVCVWRRPGRKLPVWVEHTAFCDLWQLTSDLESGWHLGVGEPVGERSRGGAVRKSWEQATSFWLLQPRPGGREL